MESGEIALSEREFARVKARVYAQAGIALSDAKRTLVISRLSKLVRGLELTSFDAYLDHLEHAGTAQDAQAFINALTTNLTRFYREDHHFAHLRQVVGELMTNRPRGQRLRIWSAGCSTGQEPYTIVLDLLAGFPELKRWDFKVLATDIDTSVLERAAGGLYPESELAGLSDERQCLFERSTGTSIRVPAAARERVAFKPLNLMADWPMRGPFDAIFCRNVAIYFDRPTQVAMFSRFADLLAADGYLYIGHSENIGAADAFRLVGKTIYQVRAGRARRAA